MLVQFARLGLRVNGDWFCSAECVAIAATRRLRETMSSMPAAFAPASRIGALLVHQGAITQAELREALDGQRSSGLRLGAEVRSRGFADAVAIVRALAAQAGVSYLTSIDTACVRSAPGGLCAEEVRALGLVPIRATHDGGVMTACPAPLPRTALAALATLTGYAPVPFIVSDEDLAALTAAYGADVEAAHRVTPTRVDGLRNAADRIADAALHDDGVTLAQAHVEPWTFVRLATRNGINAMLVTPSADEREEEEQWLAASTRH